MKQILLILFLFTSGIGQSQVLLSLIFGDKLNSEGLEFGLEGGVDFASITHLESSKTIAPFNIGFYFDIKLKNQWNVYTGVLVKSELGLNNLTDDDLNFLNARRYEEQGTYSQRIRYFIVPILMKYQFDNNIYLEAGPQLALMNKAWIEFKSSSEGVEAIIKQKNTNQINRIDAGAAFGLGYRINGKGWTIGVRFYQGFTNVYKARSKTKNRALFLKANIPIGAAKAKKRREDASKAEDE